MSSKSTIASDKDYHTQFMQAFGRGVNEQDMLSAIAAYERTLASFNSPFDHFIAGEANAISNSAKRGWEPSGRSLWAVSSVPWAICPTGLVHCSLLGSYDPYGPI